MSFPSVPSSPSDYYSYLCSSFQLSLDPSHIAQAEAQLSACSRSPHYPSAIFQLLSSPASQQLGLAASLHIKNFVLNNYSADPHDGAGDEAFIPIEHNSREFIKGGLLGLLVSAPPRVQSQLIQTIALIAKVDFPHRWSSILPGLISQCASAISSNNFSTLLALLNVCHSMFYHYRSEIGSDELLSEISYVVQLFAKPLTELFGMTFQALQRDLRTNQQQAIGAYRCLLIQLEIFYSLNSQDIVEQFQQQLTDWMEPIKVLLDYQAPELSTVSADSAERTANEGAPSVVESVKSFICELISLFVSKYEDDFKDYVPSFVSQVWNILTGLGESERFDGLVTEAIKFLTAVVKRVWNKSLFANETALKTICEKVLLTQLKLRKKEIDLFHHDGVEYIRIDIEGSDVDTRRRTTIEFIRALLIHFEAELTAIVKSYVGQLIQDYTANKAQNWLQKDLALYLILALASKSSTAASGVTQINRYLGEDFLSFFQTQVLGELSNPQGVHPIVLASSLKFVATFRRQVPNEFLTQLIGLCARYCEHPNLVVHSYAANAIEKLIAIKDEVAQAGGAAKLVPRLSPADVAPLADPLLKALFKVLQTHEESAENEYSMRAIMKICVSAQSSLMPLASFIVQNCNKILSEVAKNPKNPQFHHYLFETLACLIRYLCPNNLNTLALFEGALFPPFQAMLGIETAESFSPYVFQLMAQMLELRPANEEIPQAYKLLYSPLLAPALWENEASIPHLSRLLIAFVMKSGHQANLTVITQDNKFEGLLGIFQKLLSSRKTDIESISLLNAIVLAVPPAAFTRYLTHILTFIFKKLQSKPANRFLHALGEFFSVFSFKHSFQTLMSACDTVQKGILAMITEKVWIPGLRAQRPTEKAVRRNEIFALAEFLSSGVEQLNLRNNANLLVQLIRELAVLADFSSSISKAAADEDDTPIEPSSVRLALSIGPEFAPIPAVATDTACFQFAAQRLQGLFQDGNIRGAVSSQPEALKAVQDFAASQNISI
jgi:exportin-2 (importin alpha re-exporter)